VSGVARPLALIEDAAALSELEEALVLMPWSAL
jgi:hypothetical protein